MKTKAASYSVLPRPEAPAEGWRRIASNVLKLAVSLILILWILHDTNVQEIGTAVRKAEIWLLGTAFMLHGLGFALGALRWRLLLRARGSDASLKFLVESYLVGVLFNNFLPSTVGGDFYRTFDSWRLGQSKANAVAIVFIDRFLGILSLMFFALLALFSNTELTSKIPHITLWVGLGSLGLAVGIWILFMPPSWLMKFVRRQRIPLMPRIVHLMQALFAFQGQQGLLLKALMLSALLQINVVIHYFLISKAISLPIPVFSFLLIVPLATVITMLPISVNAIGVRESVFVYFFSHFSVSVPQAIAFAWIVYSMIVLQGIIGGVVYLYHR